MYKIRRVYRTKPGEASNVAKLVYKQAKMYQNIVILEWQDDKIMSPGRPGNNIPAEIMAAGAKYRPLLESQKIEFYEMVDPSTI